MPNMKTPDPREIFRLAEQYLEASLLLENHAQNNEQIWSPPRLLLDSFAVELYLKCLFVLDTNASPAKEHNWKRLFDSLDSNTKIAIRYEFRRIVDEDDVLRNLREINPEAAMFTDFDRSLLAGQDTFDKWRYTYEPLAEKDLYYADLIRAAVRSVTMKDIRLAGLNTSNRSEN